MAKRLGNSPAPVRPAASVIDVARHRAGLADAATETRELVRRLQNGIVILREMAQDDPRRGAGERHWQDLVTRLHRALRDAYARFALLRIALPHEDAMALWAAEMPKPEQMDAIGVSQMLDYWRSRTDAPEWITAAEMARVTHLGWPPTKETDAINRGLEERFGRIPF